MRFFLFLCLALNQVGKVVLMHMEGAGCDVRADMGPLPPLGATRESAPQSSKGGLDRAKSFRLTFGPVFYAYTDSSRNEVEKKTQTTQHILTQVC